MNQELEQYLQFFIENRQKDWPEWLAMAEFAVNNKVHMATKVSPFMANYGREMRMGGDIRKKGKVENATEFVERMKKIHKEAEVALRKTQEEMKRYADRGRKEIEREICEALRNRRSGVLKRGKTTIAEFDEDSPGSKH